MSEFRADAAHATELDRADPLARFRAEFAIPEPGLIYMDGNSLGRLPTRSLARMHAVVEHEWGERLIRAWGEGWLGLPKRLGAKIARLIGAGDDEVIVCDSTSVNLFKLTVAALAARPGRTKIVTDSLNFPSDLYVLEGAARLAGADYRLEVVPSPDGIAVPPEGIAAACDADTALVALTHTAFKSGAVYDMAEVTDHVHRRGALMLWDLCHSVGAMPLALDEAGADCAVGCTYKYLNAGPGAPAFLYVRRGLQGTLSSPIWGWFGHKAQFDFAPGYSPAHDIKRFLAGAPPILSMALIETGVDLLLEAGIDRLHAKSVRQSEYLIALWQHFLAPLGVTLNSPRDAARRGSHVALGHPAALGVDRALIEEMGVIPDFRAPDNIRLAITPLYTTFAEIHETIVRFRQVLVEKRHERYRDERPAVP